MAVKGTFPIRVDSNLQGFALVLRSAVCEWLLLFLLLLDAAFSYFLTKFAQYCELQLPCILCSRLDHILGKEKPDFYRNLLCSDHRSEISSLVSCHNHGKLADIHGMCEECLLSFAKKESNEETYKLLVGKLGPDCLQKPFLSVDSVPGSLTSRLCSCCSKPWRIRPHVQKLVNLKPSLSVSKPDIPLPKSPAHRCLNRQEGLKKRKDRFSLSTTPLVLGSKDYDTLSHVGYTEVKITSDSDSDFPFSDDEDLITATRDRISVKDEYLSQQGSNFVPKSQYKDLPPAVPIQKPTHNSSILMHPYLELEKGETTTPKFSVPIGDSRHGFGEIKWQQIDNRASPGLTEFTSLDDIPLSSSSPGILSGISANEGDRASLPKKFGDSSSPDLIHKCGSPSNNMQLPVELSKQNWLDTKENGDIGHASATSNWESIDLHSTTTVMGKGTDPIRKDASFVTSSGSTIVARDLSSSKEVEPSAFSLEHGRQDCNGFGSTEEPSALKTSSPHADSSSCNKIPTVNGLADGPQMAEAPGSVESLTTSKSSSMERSRSLESSEGSVGEIEGENLVDKLKREVEHDKKRISDLYKELEEERSAAAIAANQAMAMITKLQEEKAALHMEALQYLRMMEEQAEYDVDALERANETIAEKDKEIQDLEAELDYYRIKYPEDFPEELDAIGMDVDDLQGSYLETIKFEKS